jgi:hypothetical protein
MTRPVALYKATRPLPSLLRPQPRSLTDINFSEKLHSEKSKLSEFMAINLGKSILPACSSPLSEFPKMKHPFLTA